MRRTRVCTASTLLCCLPPRFQRRLQRQSVKSGSNRTAPRSAGANWEAVAAYVDMSQALKKFEPPAEPEPAKGDGAQAWESDRAQVCSCPAWLPTRSRCMGHCQLASACHPTPAHRSHAPPHSSAGLKTRKSLPQMLITPLRAPVDLALSPFMHKEAPASPAPTRREPSARGRSATGGGGGLAAIGGMLRSISHRNLADNTDRSTRSRLGRRSSRGSHRERSRSRSRRGHTPGVRFSDTDSGGESGGLACEAGCAGGVAGQADGEVVGLTTCRSAFAAMELCTITCHIVLQPSTHPTSPCPFCRRDLVHQL